MNSDARCEIRLRVLGELALTGMDDAAHADLAMVLGQPKRLALLLYLAVALPRGFHRRDTLMAMFWPDADRDRASGSLRQALHFLRRLLPDGLLINRGSAAVSVAHERVWCDAVRFDAALDTGQEEDALELYRGDLLPGFHLGGCPDFERWLDMERERLRRRASRGALVLAYRHEEEDEPARAAEWAHTALSHAPYDEATTRHVVLLLDRLGNRGGAIRLYEAFAQRLVDHLGVEPSAETRALIADLRAGREAGPPAGVESVGKSRVRSPAGATTALMRDQIGAESYHAYLRARHLDSRRTPASIQGALEEYRRVARAEPDFAPAHAGIARALSVLAVYTAYPAMEAFPLVRHHAAKAIRLDEGLAEARVWLAIVLICYDRDWTAAEGEMKRAIELDPSCSEARVMHALYLLTPTGRFDEAVREIELARELDPMSLPVNTYVGSVCYFARRYDRAVQELRATLELNDRFPLAWWFLGRTYEQLGDLDEAGAALETAAALTDRSSLMLAQLGRTRALAADRAGAEAVLAELNERADMAGPIAYFVAGVHAALGDDEVALDLLYHAYRERLPHLVFAKVEATLDGLRSRRRFRELLLRIGLSGGGSN